MTTRTTYEPFGVVYLQLAKARHPITPMLMDERLSRLRSGNRVTQLGATVFLKKPIGLHELKKLLHEFSEKWSSSGAYRGVAVAHREESD